MALFWAHGYNALGTRQIEEETGITRFTLQTTYGGKMKLFLTTLDAYLDMFENSSWLPTAAAGLDGIAGFFETRGNPNALPKAARQGCFMLNSMVEFSNIDPQINQRAARYLTLLRQGFSSAMVQAKQDGTMKKGIDINAMTEVLLSSTLGLNAMIRASSDDAVGQTMADSIAAMARGWGQAGIATGNQTGP